MGERSSTRQARRAVAKLIERYFGAVKRELAEQTGAFWARVEAAVKSKIPDHKSNENEGVKKPVGD
jgi:hypothetical protein